MLMFRFIGERIKFTDEETSEGWVKKYLSQLVRRNVVIIVMSLICFLTCEGKEGQCGRGR